MKRLVLFFFLAFLSYAAFADVFNLFSWDSTKDYVISTLTNEGWSFEINNKNGDYTFTPPKDNIYYYGEEVKNVIIHFEYDYIYAQTISFAYYYPEDKVFSVILHMMSKDNAKIISEQRTQDDLYQYLYKAELNTCNSYYLIVGKNNKMIIGVGYEQKLN